ncbi:MAG: methyltransferase domain-containing protein [Thermoleophilia bacterium]|nr:methyltransferase domain-containing protein [Thermoleophilia bacterium]
MTELTLKSATEIYERGLDELRSTTDPASYYAISEDGARRRLPLRRWLKRAPEEEEALLDRAVGPVLDVGCGAGRHLEALRRRGTEATGVEVSRYAVAIARERADEVIHGSVFDVPETENWNTALLLDGNVGIGGEPERLLGKIARLLHPGGRVLVELEPPQTESRVLNIRLEGPGDVSDWFPWAWVGIDAIGPIAAAAGLTVAETWSIERRWFARLRLESFA